MAKYKVEIKKKDGVQHEGVMAIKEPQVINGLYAIADENGGWLYIQRDEVSEIRFTPVTDEVKEEPKESEENPGDETNTKPEEKQPEPEEVRKEE